MTMPTPERWRQIETALDAYDQLPATERKGFLRDLRRKDPVLAAEVEELLAHDDDLDRFEKPVFPIGTEKLNDALLVPRIGPYVLEEELGEGGMGTVYRAVREKPFRLDVALKLIQSEVRSSEMVRRFETEREILAGIHHPNVAQIYDGGTTVDGRPYFAMELVEGEPIDTYAERHALSHSARLEIFLQVCSAVHQAHSKLRVVHRDLKPGNILVTADGTPKLLDFGIAKSLDLEKDDGGPEAATSAWTPSYTSPEQLDHKSLTTASDVYSLGVLLYRLLTGSLPYHFPDLSPDTVRRVYRERSPRPPGLGSDLDAILLKSLARNPKDRYSSVESLAEDIRRHLRVEPVRARRPTAAYRCAKFVRRNALRLAIGAVIGVLVSELILGQARQSRSDVVLSRAMTLMVTALEPTSPDQRVDIARALHQVAGFVDNPDLAGGPLNRAILMDKLGRAYTRLGDFGRAENLLEQALALRRQELGGTDPLVAESLQNLAFLEQSRGHTDQAMTLLREAIQIHSHSEDSEVIVLSQAIHSLAIVLYDRGSFEEAEAHFRRVLKMWQSFYGAEDEDVLRARGSLASTLSQLGAGEEAENLYRQNLEIRLAKHGAEHKDVATSRNQLATALFASGRLEDAVGEAREALRIRRQVYGLEHRTTGLTFNNLGRILLASGQLDVAEDAFRQALAILGARLGDEHHHVAVVRRNLAEALVMRGASEEAEPLVIRALETLREHMEPDSWRIADAAGILAMCRAAQGRFAEAEEPLQHAYAAVRVARGDAAPETRAAAQRLRDFYAAWGKPEPAVAPGEPMTDPKTYQRQDSAPDTSPGGLPGGG